MFLNCSYLFRTVFSIHTSQPRVEDVQMSLVVYPNSEKPSGIRHQATVECMLHEYLYYFTV